ncbi:putative pyrroline-5-carboxylate reductase [Nemania abortiva]|nr:putative pyrroline-5-carboxylate reductase [Nemania abortiva]
MSEAEYLKAADAASPVYMTILGCGRLGSAILARLLKSLEERMKTPGAADDDQIDLDILPTRFLACVGTSRSVEALARRLKEYTVSPIQTKSVGIEDSIDSSQPQGAEISDPAVDIWRGRNTEATKRAKVVLMACQPGQVPGILAEEGMVDALEGKLILNICAGSSEKLFQEQMQIARRTNSVNTKHSIPDGQHNNPQYHFVHAMPNPASMVGESATVLSPRPADFPAVYSTITNWVFSRIGPIFEVAPDLMNAASMVAGCSVGFFAPTLMGISAGAVAAGLEEKTALRMAAQAMKGTAEMILKADEDPKELMDKVATPGGCTERGLETLLSPDYKGTITKAYEIAITRAVRRAFELGNH